MKRSDIHASNRLVLSNGVTEIVYSVNGIMYITPKGSHYISIKLEDLCDEDLQPKYGCAEIIEIHDLQDGIIWSKPVEMTVSEIESKLGITPGTLRIKK